MTTGPTPLFLSPVPESAPKQPYIASEDLLKKHQITPLSASTSVSAKIIGNFDLSKHHILPIPETKEFEPFIKPKIVVQFRNDDSITDQELLKDFEIMKVAPQKITLSKPKFIVIEIL